MPRRKTFDVFKRDNLLLEFMRKHRGEENIVTSREIKKFLSDNGYPLSVGTVNMVVRKIMYERNAPICSTNAQGYYWAVRREEIEKTIADMESRRAALENHINHLKNFIID